MHDICDRGTALEDLLDDGGDGTVIYEDIDNHEQVPSHGSRCALPGTGKVITVMQKHAATVRLALRDNAGEPVPVAKDKTLMFVVKASRTGYRVYWSAETEPVDTDGRILLKIPATALAHAGIYFAQLQFRTDSGALVLSTNYTLYVPPSIEDQMYGSGMVTLPEMRMCLMDMCAEQNELLGRVEFSDDDIVTALRSAADEFNDSGMPKTRFTLVNFPYRSALKKGACAYLLRAAAANYARNDLSYRAGDVSIADKNKMDPYLNLAGLALQEWRAFVKSAKIEMNVAGGYGYTRSPFSGV